MRVLFSSCRILERIDRAELRPFVDTSREVPTNHHEPEGTLSQLLHIYDVADNAKVAIMHQYLRPDGTIGASGRPDPKMLVVDGVMHVLKPPVTPEPAPRPKPDAQGS